MDFSTCYTPTIPIAIILLSYMCCMCITLIRYIITQHKHVSCFSQVLFKNYMRAFNFD